MNIWEEGGHQDDQQRADHYHIQDYIDGSYIYIKSFFLSKQKSIIFGSHHVWQEADPTRKSLTPAQTKQLSPVPQHPVYTVH